MWHLFLFLCTMYKLFNLLTYLHRRWETTTFAGGVETCISGEDWQDGFAVSDGCVTVDKWAGALYWWTHCLCTSSWVDHSPITAKQTHQTNVCLHYYKLDTGSWRQISFRFMTAVAAVVSRQFSASPFSFGATNSVFSFNVVRYPCSHFDEWMNEWMNCWHCNDCNLPSNFVSGHITCWLSG